jgi:uncharacterized protein
MTNQTTFQKILHFFLTKIILGFLVVAASVAITEFAGRYLLDKTSMSDEIKNVIVAIADSVAALTVYIILFKAYEKRQIDELSLSTFGSNAFTGFFTGLILQTLLIVVIYFLGGYAILQVNPFSDLLPGFATALTAGFVAEIILRGIIFRLTEEKLGTVIALFIMAILFALMHMNATGATILSVLSTAMQAGILISAAYVFTRSLWFVIFLHFAWDFAEPGIFGAINPGNTIEKSLFAAKIAGNELVTGGQLGPQNSIQALLLYIITALLFLLLAKRKNNFVQPYWKQ